MNREHIKYAIIGIAIILSAYLLGRAYTYKYRSQDTVVVTGLGETEFESDLIVWSGVLTAEGPQPAPRGPPRRPPNTPPPPHLPPTLHSPNPHHTTTLSQTHQPPQQTPPPTTHQTPRK